MSPHRRRPTWIRSWDSSMWPLAAFFISPFSFPSRPDKHQTKISTYCSVGHRWNAILDPWARSWPSPLTPGHNSLRNVLAWPHCTRPGYRSLVLTLRLQRVWPVHFISVIAQVKREKSIVEWGCQVIRTKDVRFFRKRLSKRAQRPRPTQRPASSHA